MDQVDCGKSLGSGILSFRGGTRRRIWGRL